MALERNNQVTMTGPPTAVAGAETVPPFGKSFGRELTGRFLPPLLAVTSVIAIWWLLFLLYPRLLPSPMSTVQEAIRLVSDGTFFFHMYQSLRRVFVGSIVAMFFSVGVGIYMGTVAMGERFFQPLVVLGLTIPGLMWALIAVMLFGINEFSPYFAVTVTIFPMLVINIWAGVKSLDKELIDMSHVFHFTKWMKISQVILPQLVPNIFAATRYGLGLAWKVVVVVEMFGTSNGVGYQVMKSYQVFNMEGVIAWTVTFVIAMIVIEYGIINLVERRLTAWRPKLDVWRR
ncbi:MAG TPA: ABC transporter permease [Candidatus Binatia bacterium]|jgi:NitT/TauT family transport system permease protein|nr:ABC transporter permease [Candidatus Binatia bacterium]